MRRGRAALGRYLGLVAVLLVAAWARLANFPEVLGSGEVVPFAPDGDAAYHLFRTLAAAAHFPRVPVFDPWMNWPRGGLCQWSDLYDLSGAAFVRLLGGGAGGDRAALLACLYPVALGLLVVWATVGLTRAVALRRGAGATALAAGALAATLPHGVVWARLGRTDHHVLEALSVVLLAGWVVRQPHPAAAGERRLRFEVAGVGAVLLALWGFTGGVLYVALAAAVLRVRALAAPRPAWLGSGAPALAAGAAAGAAVTWPALAQHGRLLAYAWPSLLQPALCGAAAAVVAAAVLGARLPGGGRYPARLAWMSGLGAAAALPFLAASWREVHAGVAGWLLHGDRWLANISEFQPLLTVAARQGGGAGGLWAVLGPAGLAFAAALAWLASLALRHRSPRLRALVWLALALAVLSLVQLRFLRVLLPLQASALALGLQRALVPVLRAGAARRLVGAVVLGVVLTWCALDPRLRSSLAVQPYRGPDPAVEAALDLRDAPPVRAGGRPGVLTYWGHGHQVRVYGRRPVVVNGFGTYLDPAQFWRVAGAFQADERALLALMDEDDLGYLVAGASTPLYPLDRPPPVAPFANHALNPEFMRTRPLAPLLVAGSGTPGLGVKHLEHLMPRHASAATVPGLGFPLPLLWTYEHVAGARLRGVAARGARVVAELPFHEHGRRHVYRAWTDAAADGGWELVVPLPTALLRPGFRTAPRWSVAAGRAAVQVEVPEGAVRAGKVIPVPGAVEAEIAGGG